MDLLDARARNVENPETFYIPSKEELKKVKKGSHVKLCWLNDTPGILHGKKVKNERMWVKVLDKDGEFFLGELDNDPAYTPGLKLGDRIEFEARHILDIYGT